MKKSVFLLSLGVCFILASCQVQNNSTSSKVSSTNKISSSISSSTSTISSSISSPTSTISSTISSSSDSKSTNTSNIIDNHLSFSDSDMSMILDTLKTEIPCIYSASSYHISPMNSSDNSAKALIFTFYGIENLDDASDQFYNDIVSLGFETVIFSVEGQNFDGAEKIIDNDLLQLLYYVEDNNFIVEAYIYFNQYSDIYESSTWPEDVIIDFTGGINIPAYEPDGCLGYQYTIGEDDYGEYMMLAVLGSPNDAVTSYSNILMNAGWSLNDAYMAAQATMIATDSSGTIVLYYSLESTGLELSITKVEEDNEDYRPDGGGDDDYMTPSYEKPENYSHENFHGFVLDDISETNNLAGHAISLKTDGTYDLVDSKKFAFNIQCGEFFGGKYYFFTTDYQFGYVNYSEEEGYGSFYIQPEKNEIVDYFAGYQLIPLDMTFNYDDMKMYVLWAKWELVDSDNDGYFDELSEDGFCEEFISSMNLITMQAGKFKYIERRPDEIGSTVLTGIACNKDGTMYGLMHSAHALATVTFDTDNDCYYLDVIGGIGKRPDAKYWMFYEYFHASMAFDHATGKLYYTFSDWKNWDIINGFSEWWGDYGAVLELDINTGEATVHEFENTEYEITGLFTIYYK